MYLLALVNFSKCRCHAEFFHLKNPKDPQPHYIILPKLRQLFLHNIAQYPSSILSHLYHQYPASILLSRSSLRNPSVAATLASFFKAPLPLAPFRIAKSYNFPRPHEESRTPPLSAPTNASSPFSTPYPAPLLDFRLTLENLSPSEASLPPPRITSINIKVDITNKA
jgi:hypothetical protein